MVPMSQKNDLYGFGIGTTIYNDKGLIVSIDVPEQTIIIESVTDVTATPKMSFEDFVVKYYSNANL
jgi:hypothetical protein